MWEIAVLVLLVMTNFVDGCPTLCTCKWKNGKQTVECIRKSLMDIPDDMDPGTQVLDFNGNKLVELADELFNKKQLINLQRLYLAHCHIKMINKKTFKGLTNLVELDLSNNDLEIVPTESFFDTRSLMRLTLKSNPLRALKKFAFSHLSYLNTLELSNCELTVLEEGAFQGLHSLEWLHLDGNRLKTIRGRGTLPENLKGVDLQENTWECDCHIQDLRAWLEAFNMRLSVEPTCTSPPRLASRPIKSIAPSELACLPDISPTTFYLELNEGKNVSLLCHVHAIPEATVSWWFQGQILQNNTMVAPGMHLIYYVEEGAENKRSELFIYNANSEDNGTFVCSAENPAGATQSNFTIRIVLKEEPIVIIVSFPFEYLLAAVIGVVVLGLVLVLIIIVIILKCREKQRCRNKREKTLQYQESSLKCGPPRGDGELLPNHVSASANDEMLFNVRPEVEMVRTISPSNQVRSPPSVVRYQLEQNPDLINGTESVGLRHEGDGREQMEHLEDIIVPATCLRVVDHDGYPMDYGLPKVASRQQCNSYYRTLPSNRLKRHSAANPASRYSREAEFLQHGVNSIPYDHYHTDVRYTADGYPARNLASSPPDSLRSDTAAIASVSSIEWPTRIPANFHYNKPRTKRCVSAQTEANADSVEVAEVVTKSDILTISAHNDVVANETLTESPDEGYEGEPTVV